MKDMNDIEVMEANLSRFLNILGFPVVRITNKDWRWFGRNFDSNSTVLEGHPMAVPTKELLLKVLKKKAKQWK
tara:strand:- start:324 stop:542 length:219 start_codon:yes stop_codon:yes gene_type:complete